MTPDSSASSASLAPRCSTRAPRIGPSGASSPSASRSERRSGRSHTKPLSLTSQRRRSRDTPSLVSGSASAIRRTSSQLATFRTLAERCPHPGMPVDRPQDPRASTLSAGRRTRDCHHMTSLARLERPLLLVGLALVTAHLLDLALSGPDTSVLGVLVILAVPLAWALAQPHVTRPTRLALGVAVGLIAVGFGVASHVLHVVNSGPDWRDLTGVGYVVGGLLLVASGIAAVAAPGRAPARAGLGWRAAHVGGWVAGAVVIASFGLMPFAQANLVTHAPRWAIDESKLGIAHEDVRI